MLDELRRLWGSYCELLERQLLQQRPWEEEFLHWSFDGRAWHLHGDPPPNGQTRGATSGGGCQAVADCRAATRGGSCSG